MNINKRYNRPFQLQVNVTRTMAILRYDPIMGGVVTKGLEIPSHPGGSSHKGRS